MADTLAQQLARVQAAIAAVEEHGQTITSEGETISRANIAKLYEREERLLKKIDRDSRGRIVVAEF